MHTVLKSDLEVLNAKNFISDLDSVPSQTHRLYIGLSRTTAWADDTNPPTPTDTADAEAEFWSELIGVQNVDVTDIRFVAPRVNWTSGTEYYVFDAASATAFSDDFYVINGNLEVYTCVAKSGPGITASVEPTGHNNGANIVTGDGFTWKFLYKVTLAEFNDMMTDSWMVVNWDTSDVISDQYNFGDVDAYKTLGAKYVMIRTDLVDASSGGLPDAGIIYRQVAVIYDPLDNGSSLLTSTIALPAGLTTGSGDMVYLENKSPISRNIGQSETVKLVLEF